MTADDSPGSRADLACSNWGRSGPGGWGPPERDDGRSVCARGRFAARGIGRLALGRSSARLVAGLSLAVLGWASAPAIYPAVTVISARTQETAAARRRTMAVPVRA
jgi:hypothetical protein